jgi:hypothetical protein
VLAVALQSLDGSDLEDYHHIRNIGSDSIDNLRRYFEMKAHAGGIPNEISMTAAEIERALRDQDKYFLAVVGGLETGELIVRDFCSSAGRPGCGRIRVADVLGGQDEARFDSSTGAVGRNCNSVTEAKPVDAAPTKKWRPVARFFNAGPRVLKLASTPVEAQLLWRGVRDRLLPKRAWSRTAQSSPGVADARCSTAPEHFRRGSRAGEAHPGKKKSPPVPRFPRRGRETDRRWTVGMRLSARCLRTVSSNDRCT